ncbi:MAG TPA: class I SAM-dependent methyltransferase [Chthoniobacterales bacterium]|nr:class I SAM-dependent methyltransferase [Chthoniobacterales bacterium]
MNFDRIAPHYRWLEMLCAGPLLQRCRTAFLREIQSPRHVLIVGEGNGRFLVNFLRAHPDAAITCVESSAAMLRLAQARLAASGLDSRRVEFLHADILTWTPPCRRFDLLVTHFVLDCFDPDQLAAIVARLAAAAAPEARWLVADFREPASGFAKWRARAIIQSLYFFFRCVARLSATRLIPPDALLARHGFVLRERRTWDWGLLHSDLWAAT